MVCFVELDRSRCAFAAWDVFRASAVAFIGSQMDFE